MSKSILVAAAAMVLGAGWAVARGPDTSERMNAVEMQGAGSGSTTSALAQAAVNRSGSNAQYASGKTAVPAAEKASAAMPATQPAPQGYSSPDESGR